MKLLIIFSINIFYSCIILGQWTNVNIPSTDYCLSTDFVDDLNGYVMADGSLWKTSDGGVSWTQLYPNHYLSGNIKFISIDTGFAITDTGLIRTTNGGFSWTEVLITSGVYFFSSPYFTDQQNAILVGWEFPSFNYRIYKTTDQGSTWSNICNFADTANPYAFTIDDIIFPNPLTGYFASYDCIYKTTDGGYTWNRWSKIPIENEIHALIYTSPDTMLSVGSEHIFKTYDGGQSWQTCLTPGGALILDCIFISTQCGYICGGDGLSAGFIWKSTDAGFHWVLDYSSTSTFSKLSFPSTNIAYATGSGGSVIKNVNISMDVKIVTENTFDYYPNPASDYIYFLNSQNDNYFELINSQGEKVLVKNSEGIVNISFIPPGLYILKLFREEKYIKSEKILINH
jgi:photosystem II stability/assembly factor-like uncharacterized protein